MPSLPSQELTDDEQAQLATLRADLEALGGVMDALSRPEEDDEDSDLALRIMDIRRDFQAANPGARMSFHQLHHRLGNGINEFSLSDFHRALRHLHHDGGLVLEPADGDVREPDLGIPSMNGLLYFIS